MIGIIDYGSGNIKAIANVYQRFRIPFLVARTPGDVDASTKIILPGVGAFDQVMSHLNASGLRPALTRRVIEDRVPTLGICVGMQLLAARSDEGQLPGLGWIDGEVRRFDDARFTQRTHLPHMGWNDAAVAREHLLFRDLEPAPAFYFLHSYYFECRRDEDVLARTDYGGQFACAVGAGVIAGVQFHPEKSHHNGEQLLKNFAAA